MIRSWRNLLLLSGLFLLVACARPSPEFSTYVKPEVDFKSFSNYRWQEMKPETRLMQASSDVLHRMIVQTVDEEMTSDGIEQSQDADLIVTYRTTVSPQKGFWQALFTREDVNPGSYSLKSDGGPSAASEERNLQKGVLVIEMRDPSGSIVWTGRASAVFSKAQPGNAVSAAKRIMEQFPPIL